MDDGILKALDDGSDPRVTLLLTLGGRRVAEVSSGSVVKGQTEAAIFDNLLLGFLDVVHKSFGREIAPDLAERAIAHAKHMDGLRSPRSVDI